MALGRKHTGPQAAACGGEGEVTGDAFSVLKNVAVTIDDFQLRFHGFLLSNNVALQTLREGLADFRIR